MRPVDRGGFDAAPDGRRPPPALTGPCFKGAESGTAVPVSCGPGRPPGPRPHTTEGLTAGAELPTSSSRTRPCRRPRPDAAHGRRHEHAAGGDRRGGEHRMASFAGDLVATTRSGTEPVGAAGRGVPHLSPPRRVDGPTAVPPRRPAVRGRRATAPARRVTGGDPLFVRPRESGLSTVTTRSTCRTRARETRLGPWLRPSGGPAAPSQRRFETRWGRDDPVVRPGMAVAPGPEPDGPDHEWSIGRAVLVLQSRFEKELAEE